MFYPKEIFNIREDVTRANMRAYKIKYEKWHKAALMLFPNYYQMTLMERLKVRPIINDHVGYSL